MTREKEVKMAKKTSKISKKPVKQQKSVKTKAETCECTTRSCKCCGSCHWILPIVIIVLLWVSQATWSKVLITIAAAMLLLTMLCPCHKKQ
jgi:hypothetical protein